MAAYEHLDVEAEDGLLVVSMKRAPVNAVTGAMYDEISDVFNKPSTHDDDVRVIILRSSTRHFCAGNDLADFVGLDYESSKPILRRVREAFAAISDCDVPVIAAVHGAALGSGVALAASCDVIIASDDARFGLPEVSVGAMGGARHLARLVPQPLVRAMFLTADPVEATRLERYGAIYQVVPRSELDKTVRTFAQRIARHSPVALRIAKRALNMIERLPLKEGYEYEQSLTRELSQHPDAKEAVAAVLEKRPPAFSRSPNERSN